jgi:hypothetical protein
MIADVTIKKGDTLIADCTYRNAAGEHWIRQARIIPEMAHRLA